MSNKYIGLVAYSIFIIYYWIVLETYDKIYYQNRRKITSNVFLVSQKFHQFYFTVWNFTIQVLFVALALCSEIVTVLNFPQLIQDIFNGLRSYLYTIIVFPSSLFVSLCFWILYLLNRDFVLPKDMGDFYPQWMNQSVHTAILIPVLLEVYLPKKFPTIPYWDAIKIFTLYVLTYISIFLSIYLYFQIWLYPIFTILSWSERFFFLFCLYIITLCLLLLGIFIQNRKTILRD